MTPKTQSADSPSKPCEHPDAYVKREGMTGLCGRVICPDCGYEREWNVY